MYFTAESHVALTLFSPNAKSEESGGAMQALPQLPARPQSMMVRYRHFIVLDFAECVICDMLYILWVTVSSIWIGLSDTLQYIYMYIYDWFLLLLFAIMAT